MRRASGQGHIPDGQRKDEAWSLFDWVTEACHSCAAEQTVRRLRYVDASRGPTDWVSDLLRGIDTRFVCPQCDAARDVRPFVFVRLNGPVRFCFFCHAEFSSPEKLRSVIALYAHQLETRYAGVHEVVIPTLEPSAIPAWDYILRSLVIKEGLSVAQSMASGPAWPLLIHGIRNPSWLRTFQHLEGLSLSAQTIAHEHLTALLETMPTDAIEHSTVTSLLRLLSASASSDALHAVAKVAGMDCGEVSAAAGQLLRIDEELGRHSWTIEEMRALLSRMRPEWDPELFVKLNLTAGSALLRARAPGDPMDDVLGYLKTAVHHADRSVPTLRCRARLDAAHVLGNLDAAPFSDGQEQVISLLTPLRVTFELADGVEALQELTFRLGVAYLQRTLRKTAEDISRAISELEFATCVPTAYGHPPAAYRGPALQNLAQAYVLRHKPGDLRSAEECLVQAVDIYRAAQLPQPEWIAQVDLCRLRLIALRAGSQKAAQALWVDVCAAADNIFALPRTSQLQLITAALELRVEHGTGPDLSIALAWIEQLVEPAVEDRFQLRLAHGISCLLVFSVGRKHIPALRCGIALLERIRDQLQRLDAPAAELSEGVTLALISGLSIWPVGERQARLQQAVEIGEAFLQSQELSRCPPSVRVLSALATILLDDGLGSHERNVGRAIEVAERAVEASEGTPPDVRAYAHAKLANALLSRAGLGDAARAADCLNVVEAALQQAEIGDVRAQLLLDSCQILLDLAGAGHEGAAARAVEQAEAALRDPQAALPTVRASLKACLADALLLARNPATWARALAEYEEARELLLEAEDHSRAADVTVNYALRLSDSPGDPIENRDRALTLLEEAGRVLNEDIDPIGYATVCLNQGHLLGDHPGRSASDRALLASRAYRAAARVYEKWNCRDDLASTLNNLAVTYIESGAPAAVEEAIGLLERATTMREGRRILWAESIQNLALAYRRRSEGDRSGNLEKSVALYGSALTILTKEAKPTGWANTTYLLAVAVLHQVSEGDALITEIDTTGLSEAETILAQTGPRSVHRVASLLAYVEAAQGNWRNAAEAARRALRASRSLFETAATVASRETWIGLKAGNSATAAVALAQLGDLKGAVMALEFGRSWLVDQTLGRQSSRLVELKVVEPSLHAEFSAVLRSLEGLEAMERREGELSRPSRTRLRATVSRHAELLTQIRALPGFLDFLEPGGWDEVISAVSSSTLAYVVGSPFGTLVLVVTSPASGTLSLDHEWLPGITDGAGHTKRGPTPAFDIAEPAHRLAVKGDVAEDTDLATVLSSLAPLGSAISQLLRRNDCTQVALVACGSFSLIPIHACPTETGGLAPVLWDEFDLVYTLSAATLARGTPAASAAGNSICVLGDSLAHTQPLPFARAEARAIGSLAWSEGSVLIGEGATRDAFSRALPASSLLHVACHCHFMPGRVGESRFDLAGGESFTLNDVFSAVAAGQLRLVVLSGCASASVDEYRLPEEGLGLASAFIASGASAVVGSLWRVQDLPTSLIMIGFWERLAAAAAQGTVPPEGVGRALRDACLWLRQARHTDLRAFAARWKRDDPDLRRFVNILDAMSVNGEEAARPYQGSAHAWAAFLTLR